MPVLEGADALADTEIAMLPRRHRDETQLALDVGRLLASTPALSDLAPWAERVAAFRGPETAELTDEQFQAILTALTRPLSVLTGDPGCGKTHTLPPMPAPPGRPATPGSRPPDLFRSQCTGRQTVPGYVAS